MRGPTRKREAQVNFRVSPQELEMIEQKMAQLGTSNREAYLRKMALDGYVVKLELPELKELVSLMRYSSNNLNQLTRRVHETGRIYDADLEDISQRQDQLWAGVRAVSYTHLGVIFRVPGQNEPDGRPHYVTADEYLSGNVRRKLRQAQRAAEQDPSFAINVEALLAAQPKDLDASEIEVRLGATWIDKEYI